jgi:hypothetical protein
MAEYSANAIQLVQPNSPIIFTESPVPCNRGLIFHRDESSSFLVSNNAPICACGCNCKCRKIYETRYKVDFHGNIAIPTGGTVVPISVALAISGEPILTSRAIVTPAAVEEYGNVTSTAIITVPRGCCFNVSIENTSEAPAGGTAPAINVQNANLVVQRIA